MASVQLIVTSADLTASAGRSHLEVTNAAENGMNAVGIMAVQDRFMRDCEQFDLRLNCGFG